MAHDPQSAVPPPPADELHQLREILFGAQSRLLDQRLQALNQQMTDAIDGLRAEITRIGAQWEAQLRQATQTLTGRIDHEVQTRAHEAAELRQATHRADADLSAGLQGAQQHFASEHAALVDQFQRSQQEMQQRLDELNQRLNAQGQGLRRTMTGRTDLARLLQDVATRLADVAPDDQP